MEAGGLLLEYKLLGTDHSKEYVVFLHGIGGSSNIFFPQIKEFKNAFNVITVNLPGHKKSPSLQSYDEGFSFNKASEEVLKVLDDIGIEKAHFVGISLGSVIIHNILSIAPERVSTAVLGGAITRVNLLSKLLLLWGRMLKNITPHLWLYNLFARILMPKNNHKSSREAFTREASQMKRSDFLGWYEIVSLVNQTFVNVKNRAAKVPKLYLTGEDDHMFKKDLTRDVANMSQSTLLIVSDSGHVVNLDQPETFNECSVSFIQSNGELNHSDLDSNVYAIKS